LPSIAQYDIILFNFVKYLSKTCKEGHYLYKFPFVGERALVMLIEFNFKELKLVILEEKPTDYVVISNF